MHVHLPKPLHGWREFVGEVGIIVIGVLIALGAEQVVEDLHWRHTVSSERKALDADVTEIWRAMSARVVIERCVDDRLNELALVFARHARGEPLGITAPIGRPTVWTGSTGALQMASADGSLSHMSTDQKRAYFAVQSIFEIFSRTAWEERDSWRTLDLLDDPATLNQEDWRELHRAYRDALNSNQSMHFNLTFGARGGTWLTPFKPFRGLKPNTDALVVPAVQQLCRPAVKR